jgi:Ser/Thr protein kinase RdoA (MazF antagonist)
MKKKWYVFDIADCFSEFDSAGEAAESAAQMAADGYNGIEIRHFTTAEFEAYCDGGEAALKKVRAEVDASV